MLYIIRKKFSILICVAEEIISVTAKVAHEYAPEAYHASLPRQYCETLVQIAFAWY